MARVPSQRLPGDAAAPPGARAVARMHPLPATAPGRPACSDPGRERLAAWKRHPTLSSGC